MNKQAIEVLIAEDSKTVRSHLVHILEADPQIKVVGTVDNGQAAVDFVTQQLPDVILMDVHMPALDGLTATRRIMEKFPVPIVICTATSSPDELALTFEMIEAGAVACVGKPTSPADPDYRAQTANLGRTVKLMSEVRVVRRWPKDSGSSARASEPDPAEEPNHALVACGASTGGPLVLQTILNSLPKNFSAPILVVQHSAAGFLSGLTGWLERTTGFHVRIAAHDIRPDPGQVYFAPDGFHMGVHTNGSIRLSADDPEENLRPAVSYLFRTVARTCARRTASILLTGMGRDGAAELKMIRERGGLTIAQDQESSVVHGMPGEAIKLNAAAHVLPPEEIAAELVNWTRLRRFDVQQPGPSEFASP